MASSDRGFRALAQESPDAIVALVRVGAPGALADGARIAPADVDDPHLGALTLGDARAHGRGLARRATDPTTRGHLRIGTSIVVRLAHVVVAELPAASLLASPETACFATGADGGAWSDAELCTRVATALAASNASWARNDLEEILAMSDTELDSTINENGGDAAGIRARGAALAKQLDERLTTNAWHGEMEDKLEAFREVAAAHKSTPVLPRAELMKRLTAARNNPRFSTQVATLFQKKTEEAATDQELQDLLDRIELLAKLDEED